MMTAEQQRLKVNAGKKIPIEQWGPYLSERQWGTVREDYSETGDAWNYFPFSHSHSRAYRWGEDGIGGISDLFQNLCFSVALWNGKDDILKERLYGLGNYEGNHGEDVKELYYYLDNLPSHYYMKMLYKYPQKAFPYNDLIHTNRRSSRLEAEYELLDTGLFNDNKYFDVYITYAKNNQTDIAIKIEIVNRGSADAFLAVLPTLWFYNRWCYGGLDKRPIIRQIDDGCVKATHERIGDYYLYFQKPSDRFFTENETNMLKLFGKPNTTGIFTKDAINDAVVEQKNVSQLRQAKQGTKFSPVYNMNIPAGGSKTISLRLCAHMQSNPFGQSFDQVFVQRKEEADDFYKAVLPKNISNEHRLISRQALAGLLWSKQYYHFDIERWISTSDGIAPLSNQRRQGRNHEWPHLKNQDIILMPDKWEYPWYAAWDLAFHCIPMAMIDPTFAKHQLLLIMREWYMKPDGQLPAYEWNFSDVNPPVQSYAALEVYRIEKRMTGEGDLNFLKRVFQKLIINFTWWINRKDPNGNNIFEGGFLGLDNIGVFNRSMQLGGQMELEQADSTSWMGMYALNMMDMAIEIAINDISFEDTATKFFEHFVLIAEALNELGMWNDEDKFYYDTLAVVHSNPIQLRIKSIVGLTSIFAVSVIESDVFNKLEDFTKRINWFEKYRKSNQKFWPNEERAGEKKILISLIPKERLIALLKRMLDETEFLSPGGIRALSKFHEKNPYSVRIEEIDYSIQYDPGDSTSDFYGGNSNWRGPVWIPINYLIIESIRKYGKFYGDSLKIEYPSGSGDYMNLEQVSSELAKRVISLFEKDDRNERRHHLTYNWFYSRPENRELILFYEYFHGDSGRGLGASHQTGWSSSGIFTYNRVSLFYAVTQQEAGKPD